MSRPAITHGATQRVDRKLDLYGTGAGSVSAIVRPSDANNATFLFTGSAAEDEWTDTAHGYVTGLLIQFSSVGTGSPEFLVTTDYWVIRLNANTFQLATTLANAIAGTPIEGSADSIGTWTVTVQAQTIRAGPPAGARWAIRRLLFHLEDGASQFNADQYGGLSALSTGTQIQVGQSDGTVLHYLTGEDGTGAAQSTGVKTNMEFSALMHDVAVIPYGAGNDAIAGRWTFKKSGKDIRLDGDAGDEIQVVINDDLNGLVTHTFIIQGEKVD